MHQYLICDILSEKFVWIILIFGTLFIFSTVDISCLRDLAPCLFEDRLASVQTMI